MTRGLPACLAGLFLFIVALGATGAFAAEPIAYPLEGEKPAALVNGRIAFAEGVADRTGHRFMLQNLEIVQPVGLAVVTMNDDEPVEMLLGQDRWDQTIRSATTSHGTAGFQLRTQGDILISVKSKTEKPSHYLLIAWVGDPVQPKTPALLKQGGGAAPPRWTTWLVAGGLLVLLVVAVGLMRRRKAGAAGVVIALVMSGAAATLHATFAQPSSSVPPPSSLPAGALPPRPTPNQLRPTTLPPAPSGSAIEPPSSLPRGAFGPGPIRRSWNQIHDPNSALNQRVTRVAEEYERFEHATVPFNFMNSAATAGFSALDYWQASDNFTPEDVTYLPDFEPDGMPQLPVACSLTEDGASCAQCYSTAQRHLQGMMLLLERLRAAYDRTKKYTDASIAFGDNMSNIGPMSGFAWQTQRRGILETFAHFEQTYEQKRQGMMGSLRRALGEIDACEAQYFDNHDWYNRYGFIYYQFMDARYKH
jgi:hypothetical protein